jgi:hypothetical protein
MAAHDGTQTMVHEIAHWIEDKRPDILQKVVAYGKSRILPGETPKRLIDLFPAHGYKPDEWTHEDSWKEKYTGKFYWRGANDLQPGVPNTDYASEVLSMGLERYYEKPHLFAKEDPSFFRFIHNLTKNL